jgi:SPP1 family phage portal protein
MTIESLQTLIDARDIDKIKSTLETLSIVTTIGDSIKQYEIKGHAVNDETKRRDKIINDEDGNFKDKVPVARIPLPMQKKIVLIASAFLGVPEINATPNGQLEQNFITIINKVLEDNKFDYKFNSVVKKTKSEKQAAILVYTQSLEIDRTSILDLLKPKKLNDYWAGIPIDKNTKFKLRFKVLSQSNGDSLYPVFDAYGDMIAFGRYYEVKETVNGTEQNTAFFDLYTNDKFYFSKKEGNSGWTTETFTNNIGKIPVIYFSQPLTDWDDVQPLIERLETKISNHADTNDYYDSPIVKAKGEVKGFSDKGESGKVLQMDEGADAEYMTYDNLPESMKMEMDNLVKFIHSFTHTPDISFENLKNLGYFSTIALKVMFMDAHLKAYDSEEIFGEGAQRLYNYLKKAISVIAPEFVPALTLQIKPKFNYFIPQNIEDEVNVLVTAYQAGMISKKTMIEKSPLVEDAVSEMEQIEKETKEKAASAPPLPPPTQPIKLTQ